MSGLTDGVEPWFIEGLLTKRYVHKSARIGVASLWMEIMDIVQELQCIRRGER